MKFILNRDLIILEKKIEVGDSFSNILSKASPLENDLLKFIHSDNIKNDSSISKIDYDKLDNKIFNITNNSGKESKMKFGKLLKHIGFDISKFKEYELEQTINKFSKSETNLTLKLSSDKMDIIYAYSCDNYIEASEDTKDTKGDLLTSCMRSVEPEYFELYYNNENINVLVLMDNDKRIYGRAIVWTDDEGKRFIDRIYLAYKKHMSIYINYINENNISEIGNNYIKVDLENIPKIFPFLDTVSYLNTEEKIITNDSSGYDYDNEGQWFILTDVSGQKTQGEYSEYFDTNILEPSYSNLLKSYIHDVDTNINLVYFDENFEVKYSLVPVEYKEDTRIELINLSSDEYRLNLNHYTEQFIEVETNNGEERYCFSLEDGSFVIDVYQDGKYYINKNYVEDFNHYKIYDVPDLAVSLDEDNDKYELLSEACYNKKEDTYLSYYDAKDQGFDIREIKSEEEAFNLGYSYIID